MEQFNDLELTLMRRALEEYRTTALELTVVFRLVKRIEAELEARGTQDTG